MLPAADQLYGDADFIFQQDLAPAHSAKATSSSSSPLLSLVTSTSEISHQPVHTYTTYI